jgi:hypothetical protein
MYRFPQQHHPTSFPKINLPVELMIQTWNHNLMWWYFFFLQNQWDIFPHVPSPRFHNHHDLFFNTITQLHLSFHCLLVYFHFSFVFCVYLFSIFLLVHLQTWILNFLLCISLSMSSSWCLVVTLLCRLSLTYSPYNIVLCKLRFSMSTFFLGLWHFKQLSFQAFIFLCFALQFFCFSILLFVLNLKMFVCSNFCELLLPLMC